MDTYFDVLERWGIKVSPADMLIPDGVLITENINDPEFKRGTCSHPTSGAFHLGELEAISNQHVQLRMGAVCVRKCLDRGSIHHARAVEAFSLVGAAIYLKGFETKLAEAGDDPVAAATIKAGSYWDERITAKLDKDLSRFNPRVTEKTLKAAERAWEAAESKASAYLRGRYPLPSFEEGIQRAYAKLEFQSDYTRVLLGSIYPEVGPSIFEVPESFCHPGLPEEERQAPRWSQESYTVKKIWAGVPQHAEFVETVRVLGREMEFSEALESAQLLAC